MKVLIVSDTHGHDENLERAVMQERQTHLIFPEISQYYPVRMVPVRAARSSS